MLHNLFSVAFDDRLKPSSFQIIHQIHIKLPYIKITDILPVQIDHIPMGYPTFAFCSEKCVIFSPWERGLCHKAVIRILFLFNIEEKAYPADTPATVIKRPH